MLRGGRRTERVEMEGVVVWEDEREDEREERSGRGRKGEGEKGL